MATDSGLADTAAQDATTEIAVRPCLGITITCTSGTLNVKMKNANDDLHDADSEGWNLAAGESKEFTALLSNRFTGFVPAGVGAAANYSWTTDVVG